MPDANQSGSLVSAGRNLWRGNRIVIIALVVSAAIAVAFLSVRDRVSIGGRKVLPVEGDPYADAVAALREEIGTAALESGVIGIPRRNAPRTDLAMRVGPYFVALDGAASYMTRYDDSPTRATPSAKHWRLARLREKQARAMIVALRHIFDVLGEDYTISADPPAEYDYRLGVRTNINTTDEMVHGDGWKMREAICARTAVRYLDRAAKDAVFLDDEAQIAALAREMFVSSMRKEEPFRQETVWWAIQYMGDFPDKDSLPILTRIRARQEGRTLAQRLQGVPLLGMLVGSSKQRHQVPDVSKALWSVTELSGRTDEERAQIMTEAVFGPSSAANAAAAEIAMYAFLRTQPARFAQVVAERWGALAASERTHIIEVARPNDDVEPIAKLAAADANPALRAEGVMTLAWIYGGHEYAGEFLAGLPAFASLNASSAGAAAELYYRACLVNTIHDETAEVALFFADEILKTPATSEAWRLLAEADNNLPETPREWGAPAKSLPAIAATLARVGGRENADALVHLARCYGNAPMPDASGKPVRIKGDWPPFARIDLRRELVASSDSFLDDAMYEYVKATDPDTYGSPICEMFIFALATKGDVRLDDLLEPVVEKAEKREAERLAEWQAAETRAVKSKKGFVVIESNSSWQPFEPDLNACRKALGGARLGTAGDTVEYLIEHYKPYDDVMDRCAILFLSERLTTAELEALLADKRAEELRGVVYFALVKRREMEGK